VRSNPLSYWLIPFALYCLPNLILVLVSIKYEVLIVDMRLVLSTLDLATSILCIALLIMSFLLIVYCGQFCARHFVWKQPRSVPIPVGIIVFCLQLFGLLILFLFDFGRVGGTSSSGNPLVILLSHLHVDAIFLIYYGHKRGQKIPYLNLLLYLLSSSLRGWSGVWLILFLIEVYYAFQRFSVKKLLPWLIVISVIGLLAYPVIDAYKNAVRSKAQISAISSDEETLGKLLVRLQHVTSVLLIAQERNYIYADIKKGDVLQFYADNIFGRKLLAVSDNAISLQKYLTINYLMQKISIDSYWEDFGWYVHTGIAGWLFVIDWYAVPFYCLYVIALIAFPYWLAARYIGAGSMIPVFHTASLVYVFHGWFSEQIGFITGLFWYLLIWKICSPKSSKSKSILTKSKPVTTTPVGSPEAVNFLATSSRRAVAT